MKRQSKIHYFVKFINPVQHFDKSQTDELKSIITQTDKQIDQLVYELYELTEEEIKIVEGE